jgi:hypothetical protein
LESLFRTGDELAALAQAQLRLVWGASLMDDPISGASSRQFESLPSGHLFSDLTWLLAQVERGYYARLNFCFQIINAKGKSARQHTIAAVLLPVNSVIQSQTLDVCQQ